MIPNVYRGKVLSTLNWIEGYHAAVGDRHYISLPLDVTSTSHVAISDFADIEMVSLGPFLEVVPETVCACTHKPDKNGVLIYENDIVVLTGHSCYYAYVEFDASCGCYFVVNHDIQLPVELSNTPSSSMSVVGNVFDNAYLLNSRSAW